MNSYKIAVIPGDGTGPEVVREGLKVLEAAASKFAFKYETVNFDFGGERYLRTGEVLPASAVEDFKKFDAMFLGAIGHPDVKPGILEKGILLKLRFDLNQYINLRPVQLLDERFCPLKGKGPADINFTVIRENSEGLYAGAGGQLFKDTLQEVAIQESINTRFGIERCVRYAFEYARAYGRKKVTCFIKDNIMKMTDGLFHQVFDEIGAEYGEIEKEHWIVDIGAAKLADTPEAFDVIVMPNLYGDILSDVAAQIAGSVGLAGSANIGDGCAMFEAIHGSAPRRAGQNLANPSGLFLGAVQMLVHIGQADVAEKVHNAWLKTIEDGVHTYDIFKEGVSKEKVGTKEFAAAVVARIGQKPKHLKPVDYSKAPSRPLTTRPAYKRDSSKRELVGVDVFVCWPTGTMES